jgi:hypothetical protein
VKSYRGPPMTLGNAAGAKVRLIVWCKSCQHRMELEPVEMAARYGAKTPVLDWREKLVCSKCGGRQVDMVVTGTKRRGGASVRTHLMQFPTIGLFERNANDFKGTRNTKAQKSWSSRAEPEVRIRLPPAVSLRTIGS